jgi:hypothetical protein
LAIGRCVQIDWQTLLPDRLAHQQSVG